MNDTKSSNSFVQGLLGIPISFTWGLFYVSFITHSTSLSEYSAIIVYFLISSVFAFCIGKYANYKPFALSFFITSIAISFLVYALIGSISWF
ncbi:hypothetical protein [Tepidibacter aestuarii]|uniref:hypothetical protein n=1 Tax=Tepidibacter aestuarii TaxID=2925782 RepID=UPI0020BF3462|nr:hypothetical protein [Tepidibacter aestuarii]CAH2213493.1 membrane protein of unknown function [Tepidibacter aestuarii]